jgi:putative restriction endonuclease
MATADRWRAKLAKLNPDKARGDPAPHKPLLLLVLLDLAARGQVRGDVLPLTPELAFRFCEVWRIVAHRRTQRPDVRYPFHHLKTNGFWRAIGADGRPSPHRNLTRIVAFDPDFRSRLNDPSWRDEARRLLIATYFEPEERIALYALWDMPIPSEGQIERDRNPPDPDRAERKGREVRFRLNVVAAYNYTCALTGYRLTTAASGSIVDAAHIHQFADSRNNDPQNGLALSKNAHWLFDNGVWTISDDYTILVAVERFAEESPNQRPLGDFQGRRLVLPGDRALWPHPVHLAWHRKHKFRAG